MKTKCRICRGKTIQKGFLFKCKKKSCGAVFWHRKVLFEDLENEVNQTTHWDGVRNYQARNNMQKMQIGDDLLFYYSNSKPNYGS